MTFGRPVMVGEAFTTRIPSMIDNEYLQESGLGTQPQDVPSRMGLFVSSCELFEILADILSCFYGSKNELTDKSSVDIQQMSADVLLFNRRLDKFSASIPKYLQIPDVSHHSPFSAEGYINLQQQVLHCR